MAIVHKMARMRILVLGAGGPDEAYIADEVEFGTSRIKRWFGNDWTAI